VNLFWTDSVELIPGIKVEGETSYKGSLNLGLDSQKNSYLNLRGVWDLSRGQFQFEDYFYKEKGSPFSLRAKLEQRNNQVLAFEGNAEGKKTFLKFSLPQKNHLELSFPQVFSSPRGSFTGTLGFKLCGESQSRTCSPSLRSYDLRLSDWLHAFPGQEMELKVSGEVKKNTKGVFYKNLRAKLSEQSWIKVDADLNENQSIKDIACNLSWVSTQADLKTRTVKARANLNDEGGKMRANTFGTGKIILREEPQSLCVPKESVHWEGCCNVVFVRDANFLSPDAPKFFSVRKVRIGIRDDNQVEILAGLLPGELVVKQGSGLLLSELLKGSLGEGCACHSKK
jgi:hypothetical protein